MSNAAALLQLLRGLNTALSIARNLKISYASLGRLMQRADAEGRDLTLAELAPVRKDSDDAHSAFEDAIERHGGDAR